MLKASKKQVIVEGLFRMISQLEKLTNAVAKVTMGLAAFTVIAMCLHVAAGILTRAIFSTTLEGTVEIVSHFYMVIIAFAPWAYVQMRGEHVSVDVLQGILPSWANLSSRLIANLLTLGILGYLAWALMDMALLQTGIGELVEAGTMEIPVWPTRWIAFFGVAAMLLMLVVQLLQPGRDPANHEEDGESSLIGKEGGV